MLNIDKDNIDDKIINNLSKFLSDPEKEKSLDPKVSETASLACKCFSVWGRSLYNYITVFRKLKPKKEEIKVCEENIKVLQKKYDVLNADLQKTCDQIERLNSYCEEA